MGKRVPPSERTSQRIREVLERGASQGDVRSEVIRLAVRKIVEEALEAEVADLLGREYYQRQRSSEQPELGSPGSSAGGSPGVGYRNGYRVGRLRTAEGAIEYALPQVSDRPEPFRSKIRDHLEGRSEALETLATEMYARGLSTRDIEEAFRDEQGHTLLSRTAVSQITERLWEEYEAFATRDLSEYALAYLFLDGVAERLHPGQRRDAVLCAWGIDQEGGKHLLHLAPGYKEDSESCRAFLQDLKRRGLKDPLLVTTDGSGGLIAAVEACLPRAVRQRCLVHKERNLAQKVKEEPWPAFKAHVKACYEAPSPEVARMLREDLVAKWQKEFPSAVQCFLEDFEACIAYLRFPVGHRRSIRTTNLLERLLEEDRRRTKVMPHAFGERALLKVMFAAVIRASAKWRRLKTTAFERAQLAALREELNEAFRQRHATPSSRKGKAKPLRRFSSKTGT